MHFTFGTKQGRGEEKARVKTGPKRWVGGQLTRKGKKGRKSHILAKFYQVLELVYHVAVLALAKVNKLSLLMAWRIIGRFSN